MRITFYVGSGNTLETGSFNTSSNTNNIARRLVACCDEYVSHLSNMMRVRKISWYKSSRIVVVCQKISSDSDTKNGGFLELSGSKETRECKAI